MAPLCAAHTPDPGRRCGDCELAFARRRGIARPIAAALAAMLVVIVLAELLPFGIGGYALYVSAGVLVAVAASLRHRQLEARERASFLAESLPPALPRASIRAATEGGGERGSSSEK